MNKKKAQSLMRKYKKSKVKRDKKRSKENYKTILGEIKSQALLGQDSVLISKYQLNEKINKKLERKGFIVGPPSYGAFVTISWKDKNENA